MDEDKVFDKLRCRIIYDPWQNRHYYLDRKNGKEILIRMDLYNQTRKEYQWTEIYSYDEETTWPYKEMKRIPYED